MADRGRWASPARPLVCRRAGLVCSKNAPWPGRIGSSARNGSAAPRGWQTEETRLSCLLHLRISAICPASERCRTAGCERGRCRAGCHATPGDAGNRLLRITGRDRYRRNTVSTLNCVCRQRGCARGDATAGQSSFSQLKLSVKQAKAIFISNDAAHCDGIVVVNAFQQYEWLARLATANSRAKMHNICSLRIHRCM